MTDSGDGRGGVNVRRVVLWFFFAVGIYNVGLGIIKYDFFWPSIGFGLGVTAIAAVLLRRDRDRAGR